MIEHLKCFVEQPHEAFSNLPVCPFAKKARTSGKIEYYVHSLVMSDAIESKIIEFVQQNHFETLWLIHPNCIISSDETDMITESLSEKYGPELQFFSGHPKSNFQFGGIYTRREPYPNIIVQKKNFLDKKEVLLKNTRYYNKMN
jgi:hypothetical protein